MNELCGNVYARQLVPNFKALLSVPLCCASARFKYKSNIRTAWMSVQSNITLHSSSAKKLQQNPPLYNYLWNCDKKMKQNKNCTLQRHKKDCTYSSTWRSQIQRIMCFTLLLTNSSKLNTNQNKTLIVTKLALRMLSEDEGGGGRLVNELFTVSCSQLLSSLLLSLQSVSFQLANSFKFV